MKHLITVLSLPMMMISLAHAACVDEVFETMMSKTSIASAKNPPADVIKESSSNFVSLSNDSFWASMRKDISTRGEHVINMGSAKTGGVEFQFLLDANCKLITNPAKDISSYYSQGAAGGSGFGVPGRSFKFTTSEQCYEDAELRFGFEVYCDLLEDETLKSILFKPSPSSPRQPNQVKSTATAQ